MIAWEVNEPSNECLQGVYCQKSGLRWFGWGLSGFLISWFWLLTKRANFWLVWLLCFCLFVNPLPNPNTLNLWFWFLLLLPNSSKIVFGQKYLSFHSCIHKVKNSVFPNFPYFFHFWLKHEHISVKIWRYFYKDLDQNKTWSC